MAKYLEEQAPHVYLIGAGPGDPSLLTLRAYYALKRCDIILYDDLASGIRWRYAISRL